MNKEELYSAIREYVDNTLLGLDNLKTRIKKVSDDLFDLCYAWRRFYDNRNIEEAYAIAQCMMQMMVCKINSLLELADGVNIIPDNKKFKILDVQSVAAVVRSMYELEFIFHNIFITQNTKNERDIALYLWEIKGMNNRQTLKYVPEKYKQQQNEEHKQIEEIKAKIKDVVLKLNMTSKVKNSIFRCMNKDSIKIEGCVFHKDDNGCIIEFKTINFSDPGFGVLVLDNPDIYKYMSFQTHPSYLGVLQFGQMFDQEFDVTILKLLFIIALQVSAIMYKEFVKSVDGAKEVLESLKNQ